MSQGKQNSAPCYPNCVPRRVKSCNLHRLFKSNVAKYCLLVLLTLELRGQEAMEDTECSPHPALPEILADYWYSHLQQLPYPVENGEASSPPLSPPLSRAYCQGDVPLNTLSGHPLGLRHLSDFTNIDWVLPGTDPGDSGFWRSAVLVELTSFCARSVLLT